MNKTLLNAPSATTGIIHRPKDVRQMHGFISKRFTCFLIVAFFHMSILIPAARASVIDTTMYLDRQQQITTHELETLLDRQDVQEQLVALGVDPADARQRIESLSQAELEELQQKMDNLPAGSGLLSVLGILLVVLIVLELVGITDIFSKL